MFENKDWFADDQDSEVTPLGRVGANIGKWLGFAVIILAMLYTGFHGINATQTYRADSIGGIVAGVVGIVVTEIVLLSLILKWHNRQISGAAQRVAAVAVMGIGFLLVSLATITDSQLNAGLQLSTELAFYLRWILPISTVIMVAGNHIVDELAPEQARSRQQAERLREIDELRFAAFVAAQAAEIEAQKVVVNANLNARTTAAKQIAAFYQSEPVQAAIQQSAYASVPALLRAIGVDPEILAQLPTGDVGNLEEMLRLINGRLDTIQPQVTVNTTPEPPPDAPPQIEIPAGVTGKHKKEPEQLTDFLAGRPSENGHQTNENK